MTKPKTDPLIRAARKARREFRKTPAGTLLHLMAQEIKWRRRCTLANTKHTKAIKDLAAFAIDVVPIRKEESKP